MRENKQPQLEEVINGVPPMSNPFKISLFTANGIMTKTFGLEDGKLVKHRPGFIAEGTYQVRETTLPKLTSGLKRLKRQQALGLGTPGHEKGRIVTASEHEKMGSPSDPIPRSKDHFIFHKQPTAMLFDIDGIAKPIKEVLGIMDSIIPGFHEAEKLIIPSSSSGLYLDNKLIQDSTSAHVYVVVENGTLIPHAMKVIFKRLWIAGHGHIEVSRAGSLLIRSLIDASVGKPERIIYEALPILHDGITQDRPDPEHTSGEMLDLSLLPNLTC